MPVVGLRDRVPRPVGSFEIFENDSGVLVFFRRFAPDIKVFVSEVVTVATIVGRGRGGSDSAPRLLEPRILIGRVIDYDFSDDAQIALMRGIQKHPEIIERAEIRINIKIIGNIVTIVAQW